MNSALPEDDLALFFSIVRFISARAGDHDGPTNGGNSTAGDSTAGQTAPAHTKMGESDMKNIRINIPACLSQPLENYRMAATNLPTNPARLAEARAALVKACKQYFSATEDVKELDQLVSATLVASPGMPAKSAIKSIASPLSSMQLIVPGLWCGSYHPAMNKELLRQSGITHICCCINTRPCFPADFVYLTLPADDRPDYQIAQFFGRTFDFIENAVVKERGGVLVHCGAGISRAPTITAAYLIRKLRLPSAAAVALVQSKRSTASPNRGFRQQLREYAVRLGIEK